jgi:hypothetical protein
MILRGREYRMHKMAAMEIPGNGATLQEHPILTMGTVCGKEGRHEKNASGSGRDLLRSCGPSFGVCATESGDWTCMGFRVGILLAPFRVGMASWLQPSHHASPATGRARRPQGGRWRREGLRGSATELPVSRDSLRTDGVSPCRELESNDTFLLRARQGGGQSRCPPLLH